MSGAPLPWQQGFWQQWQAYRRQPAHAYLLMGEQGMGVDELAQAMARSLLCPAGGCGQCAACHQFAAGTHADFYQQTVPEGKRDIPVEAIRTLNEWVVETAHAADGHKVVWLHPVEALNEASANALLKTLEEPPPRTTFILQGAHVGQVLPTIRSRCQHLHAPRPSQAAALAWLQEQLPDYGADQLQRALMLQFGAPLAVVAWLNQGGWQRYEHWRQQMNALAQGRQDLVQVASDWAGWMDVTEPLRLLLAWSAQQLRQSPQLRWHRLQQVIVEALAALAGSANKQLMLEQVLVEFVYGKQD
ncbi:MAG TPA: DNA polymerase III subunit delta' [Piscirickettsiaceae bacterium]|nr:DNA polymerase III subunit delta' [Piscirickettsiaceae bacterium]